MIELKNITKNYYNPIEYTDIIVLDHIDLKLEEGKIYGLVGRNGAGKTTILKMLSNHIVSYDGEILWNGENVYENSKLVEEIIYISDDMNFTRGNKSASLDEKYEFASILYKHWDEEYKKELVEKFELNTKKSYNTFSKGQKTLFNLSLGLVAMCEVVLFDEPSNGLDPNSRMKFYNELLEQHEEKENTIIISTHMIEELENIVEEVIFLHDRKIILKESLEKIKEKSWLLTGRGEVINNIKDKNIIHSGRLGSLSMIGIYDDISEEERKNYKASGVEISSISLQNLFIYMTEGENNG